LKTYSLVGFCPGLAGVIIDNHDAILAPAKDHCPLGKRILALTAFLIRHHLLQAGLPDV
jgi:hypothetical protein